MSELYHHLITPDLLAVEVGLKVFRHHAPYLYLREGVICTDPLNNSIDPFRTLPQRELIAVAEHRSREWRKYRRAWWLWHGAGLDGINLPAEPDEYGGVPIVVDPKEGLRFGQFSTPGISGREVTAAELAEATEHRQRAMELWAADAREDERRREVRRVWEAQRQEAVRSQYKAKP